MTQRTRSYRNSTRLRHVRIGALHGRRERVLFSQRAGTVCFVPVQMTGSQGMVANDVFRKDEIERPAEGDAYLLLEAGQLHKVDRSPQPPSNESGEIDTQDIGHSNASADQSPTALPSKSETAVSFAPSIAAVKLHSQGLPLADSMLGGRRMRFSRRGIDKRRTIADCVNVLPPGNLKEGVDDDPPAFLFARQSREQRMNRVPSSPNQRIGDDSTAIAELNALVGGSSDLHVGQDLDPALQRASAVRTDRAFPSVREE